jgi:hypothetical protein
VDIAEAFFHERCVRASARMPGRTTGKPRWTRPTFVGCYFCVDPSHVWSALAAHAGDCLRLRPRFRPRAPSHRSLPVDTASPEIVFPAMVPDS